MRKVDTVQTGPISDRGCGAPNKIDDLTHLPKVSSIADKSRFAKLAADTTNESDDARSTNSLLKVQQQYQGTRHQSLQSPELTQKMSGEAAENELSKQR